MKSIVYVFLFFAFSAWNQSAVQPDVYSISSRIFNSDRTISVYLPYSEDPADSLESYAVAYVFDGQFEPYTEMVRSMTNYYASSGEGIPVIVVGIHTENRWNEFVPKVENGELVPNEAAEKLALSLANEIIPFVDSNYRTNSFRIGVGHSLGGTFVLHEVLKDKPLFQAVIAVSPNLTMDQEFLVKKGEKLFQNNAATGRFMFTTVGSEANPEIFFNWSLSRLDTAYQKTSNQQIMWYCEHLTGEDHMTTFIPSFNKGYLALSSKLMLTDLSLIKFAADSTTSVMIKLQKFFDDKKKLTGEKQELTLDFAVNMGKTLMDFDNYKDAMVLTQWVMDELNSQKELTKADKELEEKMQNRIIWCNYTMLTQKAKAFQEQQNFTEAAKYYKQAFTIKDKRGTHIERIGAVSVFAQAGELDLAFKQLDLLANYFELGGNSAFIDNPNCEPLKKDPRWKKYMDKLEKNAEKYR